MTKLWLAKQIGTKPRRFYQQLSTNYTPNFNLEEAIRMMVLLNISLDEVLVSHINQDKAKQMLALKGGNYKPKHGSRSYARRDKRKEPKENN